MLLKKLTEASGVSGNEKEVRNLIISEISDYVDSLEIDKIGNIIAYKKGLSSNKKLMIIAHMDEVGLIVTDIDDAGLIKFSTVGGIDKRVLVSKVVEVGPKKINGVIGAKPIHLQSSSEWTDALSLDQLYIDIGTTTKEATEALVEIGDYIVFKTSYQEFGDNLIKAKALDDRVGCSILVDLLKRDSEYDFYGVFSVMEEIGLRGAGPAAYKIEPDISFILEGTVCYDMKKIDSHLIPTQVGKGPAISLVDRTTIYDRDFRNRIVDLAEKNNIPYQYRKTSMGGNDSGVIHTSKGGSITATISIPCRYIHSPSSVMSKNDYDNTLNLLKVLLKGLKEGDL